MEQASNYVDFATVLAIVARRFPDAFAPRGEPPKLLADETLPQLVEGLSDQFDGESVTKFYGWWTSRPKYLAVARVGGRAYDTHGHVGWQGRA